MKIGVPRETKVHEYRVGLTPESVRELVSSGHTLLVERRAGEGIGAGDEEYARAGARIAATPDEIFAQSELVVKVKEPLAPERAMLRSGQTLFTYLHLAPDPVQARELLASGAIAIAYETVTSPQGGLPLLAPMSVVAGRMSIQIAAHFLERPHGGRGILLSGAPGVDPGRVLVLGAGTAGSAACLIGLGLGGEVCVLDRSEAALRRLASAAGPRLRAKPMSPQTLAAELSSADAVIGAALVPGATAPKLVTRRMLATMKPGAVLVDISIDQGGCFETSHPTTHLDPSYTIDGIVHYCVANIPGAVPRTSTYALNHATLPFVSKLASGVRRALTDDAALRDGLNVCAGTITCRPVAESLGLAYEDPLLALARCSG